MTGSEFRAARDAFGLSAAGMARLIGVQSGRTIRKWEADERAVPDTVGILVGALLHSAAVRDHFGVTIAPAASLNRARAASLNRARAAS